MKQPFWASLGSGLHSHILAEWFRNVSFLYPWPVQSWSMLDTPLKNIRSVYIQVSSTRFYYSTTIMKCRPKINTVFPSQSTRIDWVAAKSREKSLAVPDCDPPGLLGWPRFWVDSWWLTPPVIPVHQELRIAAASSSLFLLMRIRMFVSSSSMASHISTGQPSVSFYHWCDISD